MSVPQDKSAPRRALASRWLFCVLCVSLIAARLPQTLYMPRTYRRALLDGTRSSDGRPGSKYWENHARYRIAVTASPPNRTIHGTEQVSYTNNSPDTLRTLVFKLFMNVHRPGAPRGTGASQAYLTTGEHVDSLAVNGKAAEWPSDPSYFTSVPVTLPSPLAPRDSVRLDISWHYDLAPAGGSREGVVDSTTYFVAYFYPRVAVFDDVDGWDSMDFTGQQEFYSDFNDYDVTVNVPANFVVWGTGTLTNASTVLQAEPERRFRSSFTSDEPVHIATANELAAHTVTAQTATNGWHFTAANIPDMAFGISVHYAWDGGSVVVDDATKRRVSVQSAFNDTAADFHSMVRFARHSLGWLSHSWPGVPYPYEKSTVFQGGAGMEYPMMVNDESYPDTTFSRLVALHEIAHTYFPFYMGIDETRYGFMDEGWATTFEYLFERATMQKAAADSLYENFRVASWINDPSIVKNIPIITPQDMLKGAANSHNPYGKSSLGYLAVKDLLGDEAFRKCLDAYIDRWHGKHPQPWDFFATFNDVSGRDLDWFWNNWFFGTYYIDFGVRSVTRTNGSYAAVIDNVGGLAAPFDLQLEFSDGSTQSVHETPTVWMRDQKRTRVLIHSTKRLRELTLTSGIFMDADTTNNRWTAR
jgi:hypothetical protein